MSEIPYAFDGHVPCYYIEDFFEPEYPTYINESEVINNIVCYEWLQELERKEKEERQILANYYEEQNAQKFWKKLGVIQDKEAEATKQDEIRRQDEIANARKFWTRFGL